VPLFYYLLHVPLIVFFSGLETSRQHGLTAGIKMVQDPWTRNWGHDLPIVYAVWAVVVLLLYPVCVRYDAYKRAHPGGWTRYL
jgi:hypothetical protein